MNWCLEVVKALYHHLSLMSGVTLFGGEEGSFCPLVKFLHEIKKLAFHNTEGALVYKPVHGLTREHCSIGFKVIQQWHNCGCGHM